MCACDHLLNKYLASVNWAVRQWTNRLYISPGEVRILHSMRPGAEIILDGKRYVYDRRFNKAHSVTMKPVRAEMWS